VVGISPFIFLRGNREMAIHITRWFPDTCGCVLEYSWDTDLPIEGQELKELPPVFRCPIHSAVPADQLHAKVNGENKTKNETLAEIEKIVPDFDKVNNWSFDVDRNVVIKDKDTKLSNKQKKDIQDACDTKYGKNKIKLN
jgi:hypothetical protein